MPKMDITIAGVGGQGSILAGVILGTAAVSYDDKFAVQTQAYSSELRGGFAATWVIVSDESSGFPPGDRTGRPGGPGPGFHQSFRQGPQTGRTPDHGQRHDPRGSGRGRAG